ncbi:SPOR domain-containing protein [Deefgea piscis]|uniref:SPOR domain-containing protein n=1 Tax=Deefgea piscis TaxID=2739061 RepID=A0A6M8SVT9_9NEIS|nr:SPOR domain-containing protein [Deefgea piscis]QKJ67410.1 SPOR domain-containing protein [Deefgea piscis]
MSDELQQLRKRARRRLVGAITLVVFALIFLWTVLDGEPPKNLIDNHPVEIISSAPALSSIVQTAPLDVAPASAAVAEVALPQLDASQVAAVTLPGKLVNHQVAVNAAAATATPVATAIATPAPSVLPTHAATPQPKVVKPTSTPVVKKPLPEKKPEVKAAIESDPAAILSGKTSHSQPAEKQLDKKTYFIQVGAYADADKAAQMVAKLKSAGVRVSSEQINTSKGALTRVRVGPTDDEAKAKAWLKIMRDLGVSGSLVAKAP